MQHIVAIASSNSSVMLLNDKMSYILPSDESCSSQIFKIGFMSHFNLLVVVYYTGIILVYDIDKLEIHMKITNAYCSDTLYSVDIPSLSSYPIIYIGLGNGSYHMINVKTGEICEYSITLSKLGLNNELPETGECPEPCYCLIHPFIPQYVLIAYCHGAIYLYDTSKDKIVKEYQPIDFNFISSSHYVKFDNNYIECIEWNKMTGLEFYVGYRNGYIGVYTMDNKKGKIIEISDIDGSNRRPIQSVYIFYN